MADKRYALDMDGGEWREYLEKALGEPKFRADQITQWLWQKHADDPAEMTNLSLALREKLAEKVDFSYPTLVREQRSSDGTRKFLWGLRDGEKVESVLMKQGDRLTACISTQVGCPLQCTFCATGLSGYVRNLSAGAGDREKGRRRGQQRRLHGYGRAVPQHRERAALSAYA